MAKFEGHIEQPRFSCAIGALQSVVAIPKAVPILHSGPGCGDMVAGFFERSKGYAGGDTSPCTNFTERDVVFGGAEKLRKIIKNSYKVLESDLQVVMTGCTGGIVGDDIESVVQEFQNEGKNRDNRERNYDREKQGGRENNNNKQFKREREQNQGNEKRSQQFNQNPRKNKRSREINEEVAKNVKKVETIDDIRSDNARITKEIYLEIASLKNINLN